MLFSDGLFVPEAHPDPRVRAVLSSMAARGAHVLRARDLLGAIVRHDEGTIRKALEPAVRPGHTFQDLLARTENGTPAQPLGPSLPRTRESFTPGALEALDRFDALFPGKEGPARDLGLELLTLSILICPENEGEDGFGLLESGLAAALLARQVAHRLQSPRQVEHLFEALGFPRERPGTESERPVLQPGLQPWGDLTPPTSAGEGQGPSPFEDDPRYDEVFDAISRALHRRTAHHLFLTGERGVGKTTVVAELARRTAQGKVPSLQGRRFVHIDCRHVPPDHARESLSAILSRVQGHPKWVVTLDGFASFLRAGREGARALLLSTLPQVRCRLIALLTPREHDEHVAGDPDFEDFFTRVDVGEPGIDVALKLLHHFARGLEQEFRVDIDAEAVHQAVVLSANYILNDQLPAKALKILHRVCDEIDYERTQRGSAREKVTGDDIVRVVSQTSGVPEETLRGIAERSDYEKSLGEVIVGQEHAVQAVATELGLIKAGMTDPGKPASVLMFLGLTGTGKTEMAKALARFYSTSKKLKTYTLGNCVEPHSVATIIGVPPGYVGNDQGGRLVNELNADPYCVFLLDEADKAHPDVLQPFLNLFDEGWLTDQRGVKAYADKAIFILTSNVGQRMILELFQQGHSVDEVAQRMRDALPGIRHSKSDRPVFTPEFLARIKRIIVFRPLDHDAMSGICRKLVRELKETWAAKRGKALEVPESLIQHIGDQAHQVNEKAKGREGGRIVRKLIAEWLEAPLQREITQRPAEYRASASVAVYFVPPASEAPAASPQAPTISVRFRPGGDP